MDDFPPELEDLTEKIDLVRRPKNTEYAGDYTKPVEEKKYVPEP